MDITNFKKYGISFYIALYIMILLPVFSMSNNLYAVTSPGTLITNLADYSYRESLTGPTNYVKATNIQQVTNLAMIIIRPSQSTIVIEGSTVTFNHKLTNFGNVSNTFRIMSSSSKGYSNNIYFDTNNNGSIDPLEPLATNNIRLGPNAVMYIILRVVINDLNLQNISSDTITISGTNISINQLNVLGTSDFITILPSNNRVLSISAADGIHSAETLDGTEYLGDLDVTVTVNLLYAPLSNQLELYYDIGATPDGSTGSNTEDRMIYMYQEEGQWKGVIPGTDLEIIHNTLVQFVLQSDGNVVYRSGIPDQTFSYRVRSYQYKTKGNLLNSICYPLDSSKPKPTILYQLKEPGQVKIEVFDLKGDRIITLVDGFKGAGIQDPVIWDGKNEANEIVGVGVYFITLQYEDIREVYKVLIIKK